MKSFNEQLTQLKAPLSLHIDLGGRPFLYFGGTSYLGLSQQTDFMALYIEGLKKYGINNGSSRGNNVQQGIYNEAEAYAAQFFGAEAALVMSSGYLAAQLAVKTFLNYGRQLYAPQTHPALWLKEAPRVAENTFSQWAENTVSEINNSPQKQWVLISNALNNLFPEQYDFSFLKQVRSENELILIVDDSHGIGILNEGRGVLSSIPAPENVKVIVVASMAKALGVDAGLILGSSDMIQQLRQSHDFLGASPPSAAGLHAFMQAETLYQQARIRLQSNVSYFSSFISPQEWVFVSGYPVYFSRDADLHQKLLKHHVLISSFPYPDQQGARLNRVVMTSLAAKEDIDVLLSAIKSS